MARARNIKPGFFINEQVADNCPLGRLLFIGLWTVADYKGDLEWKEKTLKIQLLPWDNCDLKQLAINLDKSGLIRFYSDGVKTYINIPTFAVHQNPHKNEKIKGSDIPAYSESMRQVIDLKELTINRDLSGLKRNNSQSDRADSLLLIPDSLLLIPESISPIPEKDIAAQAPKRPKAADNFDPKKLGEQMPRDLEQAWCEWVDYRKEKKLKTVSATWEGQAKKLTDWGKSGNDPIQVIRNSIDNGYQGLFFELKNNSAGVRHANYQQPRESAAQRCERQSREIFAAASAEEANQRAMGANDADLRGEMVQSGG